MKQIFLIRKDFEFLWEWKDHSGKTHQSWGSKTSEHVKEFQTFEEAKKALDKLPLLYLTSYLEIVPMYRKK